MRVALLGGTGTLGSALLGRLHDKCEVVVFSRSELPQQQAKAVFPNAIYKIGDIRDREAVAEAIRGCESVFLLAAIKHIDIAEQNPLEAIKTNTIGAVIVAEEAIKAQCRYVMFSNTDKAVLPITTYGYTKALAQNYLLNLNGKSETRFSTFLWGNVLASRGSVIPTFVKALLNDAPVTVTDERMSRFWLLIDTAVDFILENYKSASLSHAMIPPIKAATVLRVVESIARILRVSSYKVVFTGLRGVEKIHEVLESAHVGCFRSDTCPQYTDEELDAMLRPVVLGMIGNTQRVAKAPKQRKLHVVKTPSDIRV